MVTGLIRAVSILNVLAFLALAASAPAHAETALPQPTPPFKGKIGKTFIFPQPTHAPKGALIL